MSDPMGITIKPPIGYTLTLPLGPGPTQQQRDKAKAERLGIELPWDWCLVKGSVLRDMQKQLREAQQTAALRLRMCANLRREFLRKDAR